jgi:hypothetical protein
MPLTAKGKKLKEKFEKQYGKKKGQSVFYAMENSGKLKKVVKARGGKDMGTVAGTSRPARDDKAISQRMEKTQLAADLKKTKDVPFKKPLSGTQSFMLGLAVPFLGTAINLGAKQQYKSRQKFAKKQGLYRDVYKTTGKPLQPNAPVGKDYLKQAGFGKSKVSPFLRDDKKPIIPVSTTTKSVDPNLVKPKENFFNFVAYKVGGLSGGVRYGPPPKRGPNPQGLKKGGYKK